MHRLSPRSIALALTSLVATLSVGLVTATSASAIALPFHATLSGNDITASTDGLVKGAPNGTGTISLSLDSTVNQVCWSVSFSGFSNPQFGHIHQGAFGVPENPAFTVPLWTNLNGQASGTSGCSLAIPGQIEAIELLPSQFNVVLHNQQFPVGAVRGQIVKN
jgi:CHRD domain